MKANQLEAINGTNNITVSLSSFTFNESKESYTRDIIVYFGNSSKLFFEETKGIEELLCISYLTNRGRFATVKETVCKNAISKLNSIIESAAQAEETRNDNVTISEIEVPTSRIFDGKKLTKGNKKANKAKKQSFVISKMENDPFFGQNVFEAAKMFNNYAAAYTHLYSQKRKSLFCEESYKTKTLYFLGLSGKPKKQHITREKVCLGLHIMQVNIKTKDI